LASAIADFWAACGQGGDRGLLAQCVVLLGKFSHTASIERYGAVVNEAEMRSEASEITPAGEDTVTFPEAAKSVSEDEAVRLSFIALVRKCDCVLHLLFSFMAEADGVHMCSVRLSKSQLLRSVSDLEFRNLARKVAAVEHVTQSALHTTGISFKFVSLCSVRECIHVQFMFFLCCGFGFQRACDCNCGDSGYHRLQPHPCTSPALVRVSRSTNVYWTV
jgi:hypothetical protein